MSKVSRRGMLMGIVGGALVLGFDPRGRSWVTEARADTDFAALPPLDGSLSTDPAVLAEAADDFGHVVHRTPLAVLRAGSIGDVVKMVKYAKRHGLKIVGRGTGHTTFGQSQVDAGIVIDLRGLDEIHSISRHHVVVDAGVVWRDLLEATTACGRTPPVLTEYIGQTVGGTLSVGGIGGTSWRHGAQVDNVDELTVVTGNGEVVVCSRNHRKHLFDAVLAGMGMCAIIVRATLRLVRAKERARTFQLFYPDVATLLADMRTVVRQRRFDRVYGQAMPGPTGWTLVMQATAYYDPEDADELDEDELLEDLNFVPGATQILDRTYFDCCDSVYQLFASLAAAGLGNLPHTWLDIFVPDSAIDELAAEELATQDVSLFLPGSCVLLFPFERRRLEQPMFRVPDEDVFFLFDILRTAPPDAVAWALADNRRLFEENRDLGGTHYTISTVELTPQDWREHFGSAWPLLASAKAAHDPAGVLGAGVNVFG